MPEISLIPPQLKARAMPRFASFRGPRLVLARPTKMLLAALAVVLLATIAIYGWSKTLEGSLEAKTDELNSLKKERDASLERRLKETGELVSSFEGLKKEHRLWSQIFGLIEERTVSGVTFTAFEASEETAVFSLHGLAPNYKAVANQVKSLEAEAKIGRVELASVNLNIEGEVDFLMNVGFDKSLIKSGE